MFCYGMNTYSLYLFSTGHDGCAATWAILIILCWKVNDNYTKIWLTASRRLGFCFKMVPLCLQRIQTMGCFFFYACFDLTNPSKHCLMSGWVLLSSSAQPGGYMASAPRGGGLCPVPSACAGGRRQEFFPKNFWFIATLKNFSQVTGFANSVSITCRQNALIIEIMNTIVESNY